MGMHCYASPNMGGAATHSVTCWLRFIHVPLHCPLPLLLHQAQGPTFPSLTSLTTARIKFILRPLTAIFPRLRRLRLGVMQRCVEGRGPGLHWPIL